MLSTLYHMPSMNYALCTPLLSHMPLMTLCHMTTMHPLPSIMPNSFTTTWTSCLLQQSYDPTSLNLRGLDKSNVRSNSDVLSPLEPRQPWNHDDMPSHVSSTPPPATHPLRWEANFETTTMSFTPAFVNSKIPGHPSPWHLAIPKHQLCYPIWISYQLWIPVPPIIESARFSRRTP